MMPPASPPPSKAASSPTLSAFDRPSKNLHLLKTSSQMSLASVSPSPRSPYGASPSLVKLNEKQMSGKHVFPRLNSLSHDQSEQEALEVTDDPETYGSPLGRHQRDQSVIALRL